MSRLRAILIDDEAPARIELRALLAAHPEVEVVGEAEDIAGAVAIARELRPQVAFVDIQLGGESGFDLLPRLALGIRIIFVTAYDKYAIRGFEVNALDYLLKPVRRERLAEAVARLLAGSEGRAEGSRVRLEPDDYLFLPLRSGHGFVKVSRIECILARGNYSRVRLPGGEGTLVHRQMHEWEALLPSRIFLRIHRSAIVNLEHVTRVDEAGEGTFRVHLHGHSAPLPMSRRFAARIRDRLG